MKSADNGSVYPTMDNVISRIENDRLTTVLRHLKTMGTILKADGLVSRAFLKRNRTISRV